MAPLYLLFDLPIADVRRLLRAHSASTDEYSADFADNKNSDICHLLRSGLSFELALTDAVPKMSGCRSVFRDSMASAYQTALGIDLGVHLSGGNRVAPVAQGLLSVSAHLADHLNAGAVLWQPAKILSDASFFTESVAAYEKGGVFPVMATVDLEYGDADRSIQSTGLFWFAGQEIALHGCGLTGQELMRRAIRLVHDIAVNGAVVLTQNVPDLDQDKHILLRPAHEAGLLECEIQSAIGGMHPIMSVN